MNIEHFKALDITAFIGNNRFQDLGYVDSISEKTKEINKKHGSSFELSDECVVGICIQRGFDHYIFYLNQFIKYDNWGTRGHEETHVLDFLNLLPILEEKLFETQKVKINLKNIDEIEVRANIGGIYAVNQRNFNFFSRILSNYNSDFRKAFKIYNQSKLPQKKFFIF